MTTATSQIEKHFLLHNIYKRSKNYYDVQRMKEQEHIQELNRRKPNYSIETFDTRVDQSFVNAANYGRKKLQFDISTHRKRYQDEKTQTYTNSDTIYKYLTENQGQTSDNKNTKNKIKAPDLSKMLPRKGIDIKKAIYSNEDQFNNFFVNNSRSKGQLDFSLLSPRSKSSIDNINPQVQPEQINSFQVSQTKQKNNFNNSIYKCLFDYSKQGKYSNLSRRKQEDFQPKSIDKEKLDKALGSIFVNYKNTQKEFYLAIDREQPSQMNVRYNKSNQYFYKSITNRTSEQDYSSRKRKQDMIGKKLAEILKKKKITDNRQQLCDYKYFNRSSYRKG